MWLRLTCFEVDVVHPDVFSKKDPLKYLRTQDNTCTRVLKNNIYFFKFQDVRLQLYLKRGSCIGFFSEIFKTLQNSFFTVQPWIAASDLIEYLEIRIIIYDLLKCLKILTIIVDFIENIWHFCLAMKQSENRI